MTTFLVTGASRGIGLELTRQRRARGDRVIAAVRTASDDSSASGADIVTGIDVADGETVERLARELRGTRLDVVVNCAGVLCREMLDDLDRDLDAVRRQYEVNAIGPLRVTHALLDNLAQGAKVVIISSRMWLDRDNSSGGMYGYRMSKAAVNMAGRSLAVDLRPRGIAVLLLHPGMVATDMTGGRGIPVAESAAGLLARIDTLGMHASGSFTHMNGDPLPW